MKKIIVCTVLGIGFCAVAEAQDRKINTSPAYDNINQERSRNRELAPSSRDRYALMDNSESKTVSRQPVLTGRQEVINFNDRTITTYPAHSYIKKSFSKPKPLSY